MERASGSHAFNAAGGLHHAMPARASGFCVYDDPAVAIAWLLREGAERIAYVDVDVHHGDGVQAIFWDEPRVLTISIHQYEPGWFFPGTGAITERGGPGAEGSAINVPLPADTGDDGWLEAFRAVIPAAVEGFDPDVLVTQLGCDTHASDPLAQLRLTTRAYRECAKELHALAHRAAAVAGSRPAAAATSGRASCRVPGRCISRRWPMRWTTCPMSSRRDSSRRPSGEREGPVPTTFSEPDLGPGPADDDARAVADQVRRIVLEG